MSATIQPTNVQPTRKFSQKIAARFILWRPMIGQEVYESENEAVGRADSSHGKFWFSSEISNRIITGHGRPQIFGGCESNEDCGCFILIYLMNLKGSGSFGACHCGVGR